MEITSQIEIPIRNDFFPSQIEALHQDPIVGHEPQCYGEAA